ncbi:glycoside hydrolase family 32 protein [Vallitalea guaymasensis]|uniref:glycoside hydrolase family 32 protein n=1 Tax=Vallitalea guaymasensis TaxID=1185412 RepID=UPI000DE1BDE1|nr:glycoside hydrolase family 32 protein [Vallitalea guaymasensis]
MKFTTTKGNKYIIDNRDKINSKYRLNYHVMGEYGWINDPNGFCYFNNKYHLFYQYYPYNSIWGPMHWGHVTSDDLIKWNYEDIALAPDKNYDISGCFSGSGIVFDNKMYLMYTGHINTSDTEEDVRQVQNIAFSNDGIHFEKTNDNPVINTSEIPHNSSVQHFRDPKIWRKNDTFYVVIGSKNYQGDGQILFYQSKDLIHWKYINTIMNFQNNIVDQVWECPDMFQIDGNDILLFSPQFFKEQEDRFNNVHSSVYCIGKLDYKNGDYNYNNLNEIDCGFDFYAPQTLLSPDGRRIMIAWMNMWESKYPTHINKHGWAGAMTLPREVSLINDKLIFQPIREIKKYRTNNINILNYQLAGQKIFQELKGDSIEIDATFKIEDNDSIVGFKLLASQEEHTKLYYNYKEKKVVLDRTNSGEGDGGIRRVKVNLINSFIKFRIFIDKSSIEVFINDGEYTMTCRVYPTKEEKNIILFSNLPIKIVELNKWDILI